ncbi:MAG: sorbosone dehydrogenase, partial [Verrucomicrobiota bacterium]
GHKVYQRAELTCVACHQVEGIGGNLGPSLDAVGAGLTNDLLVESVLWPQRQLKEGYLSIVLHTKSGDSFTGYRDRENDGIFYLRDTVTGEEKAIPRVEISRIENVGSLMPAGLTNQLTREELRDLVAYLASLKG